MKKVNFICFYLAFIGLFFVSCLREKDLFNPDNGDQNDKVGLTADFSLKTEKTSVCIHATSIDGSSAKGVKFGVYTTKPYSSEDGRMENPAFVGYTDENGKLEAKVVVAKNVSQLYIFPLSAGYSAGDAEGFPKYDVQELITAEFAPVPFPMATRTRAAANGEFAITQITSNNFTELYVPYQDAEVSDQGIPIPAENGGSSLVSKTALSSDFINQVNALYPEKQNVNDADFSKNSDIKVVGKNGAEVWLTYIGDGDFHVKNTTVYNSLMYYNYKEEELSTMNYLTPASLHMTMLIPNTNQMQCPAGLKIQLLYWDGKQYSKAFPEGTRIGFAVAREGYRKKGLPVTDGGTYNFKNSESYPKLDGDVKGNYYSTPQLNQVGQSQAVTRWIESAKCCVTGLDIRPIGDKQSDYDFNDVLFAISSSPIPDAIEPGEVIDPIENATASQAIHGTLAFEDLWPNKGDYDMNDFVVNYTYTLAKNTANEIIGVSLDFAPIAKGAAGSTQIGFGIELPVNRSNINSVTGATLEENTEKATFIMWENVSNIAGFSGAFVNTDPSKSPVSVENSKVTITFSSPVNESSLAFLQFNPFIFVGSRAHEIHLPDYQPTSKMNFDLLHTGVDCSDSSTGIYYRMEDQYSWALDLPRETKDSPAWKYPKEQSSIISAYPKYPDWITGKDNTWYNEEKGNKENIY